MLRKSNRKTTPANKMKFRIVLEDSQDPPLPSPCHKVISHKEDPNGYIRVWRYGRQWLAHRLIVADRNQDIGGLVVSHLCNNRACINPDHLELVSQPDNVAYMVACGRQSRPEGERNPQAVLTEIEVKEIRDSDLPTKELSNKFGVTYQSIRNIKKGITWAHLDATPF